MTLEMSFLFLSLYLKAMWQMLAYVFPFAIVASGLVVFCEEYVNRR